MQIKMKTKMKQSEVLTGEINGEEFEFSSEPKSEPLTFIDGDTMIVGYLVHDDMDGNDAGDFYGGRIYATNGSEVDNKAFFAVLGMDKYGNHNPSLQANPYAVILDSLDDTTWSPSGSKFADSFQEDLAIRGAGVWIPDEEQESECDARAEVYSFCEIKKSIKEGVAKYTLISDSENKQFSQWTHAFSAALVIANKAQFENGVVPTPIQIENGKNLAKIDMAEEACAILNEWNNDEKYGIVIATYEKQDGEWTLETSDENNVGFLGTEYALSELKCEFERACDDLTDDIKPR